MAARERLELTSERLRWRCDPDRLGFETTDDIPGCREIFGQQRALDAIQLGLEIQSPGYNLYISGLSGTGKTTTVKRLLEGMRHPTKALTDLCYVQNFRAPEMPVCLALPSGRGTEFKRAMATVRKMLLEHIPKVIESPSFTERQKSLVEETKKQRNEIATTLEKMIAEKGFRLLEIQYGPFTRPAVLPVVGDEPVPMDKLAAQVQEGKLDEERFKSIRSDYEELTAKMEEFLRASRELDRKLSEGLSTLAREFAEPIIETCLSDVREKFSDPKVAEYLKELREYCMDHLELFTTPAAKDEDSGPAGQHPPVVFEVNVIVDNSRTTHTPVINETSPSFSNVFGTIERASDGRGEYRTDFTMIRAGSLHRANGGFLVMSLTDIIEEPVVWPALKRALKNQKAAIQGLDSLLLLPTSALKPEPIELDVKVVLIGDSESYQILYHYDPDFKKIFKVKADFDTEMPNDQANLHKYTQFVKNITEEEKLLPFHKTAVAGVAEEGARLAGRQDRLSTQFSDVADLVRESAYWARKNDRKVVNAEDVERAVEERIRRVNLPEEKLNEMLVDGTILLDIDGAKIGQVNGLSVFDLGDYSFGKPVRITVETSMGRAGIINIEREAELSGKTYNKGSLILEGYLRRRFAQDKPLAMSASICFEQSYGGIDGDSASSTEIYGLLSSLAELPLRQDLAVTGSVNQKGEIQPIGGVNEKIHGFYDICKARGLTGRQGVIIPNLNEKDLMLPNDVVKAVKAGKFHIYAIGSIDEGIELLTGVRAGHEVGEDDFEKDSVYFLVNEKLKRFAEQIKDYLDTGDDKE